jgi:hypothetical protein
MARPDWTFMHATDVRERLVQALEADLVGPFIAEKLPGGGQEVLPLPPSRWYLTGFLAPHYDRAPDGDDTDAVGELGAGSESQAEDAGNDEPEAKRKNRFPASMGLSVFLPPPSAAGAPDHLEVIVAFAEYIKEEVAEDHEQKAKIGWRRAPRGPTSIQVPLDPRRLASREGIRWPEAADLRLRGELRTTEIDGLPPGTRVLSLFLVNERQPLERDRDLNFIFQVRLTLRYPRGFIARPNRRGEQAADDDQRVLALMFRDRYEWAVGHNTSVELPTPDPDGTVRELCTTQIPRYEVLNVKHVADPAKIGIEILSMRELASLDGPGLTRALTPLVDAYGAWIERQRYADLDPRLDPTRRSLMERASDTKDRIAEGIALLAADAEIREAFTIANLAMHVQALQADKRREDKRYKEGRVPLWRPFQLAFILLNLASSPTRRTRSRRSPTSSTSPPAAARPRPTSGSSPSRSCSGACAARRARRGPRRRGRAPLHPAAAHARPARSRRHPDLRARGAAPPRPQTPRQRPLRRRPLGRSERHRQPPQGGARRPHDFTSGQDETRRSRSPTCPWCGDGSRSRTSSSSTTKASPARPSTRARSSTATAASASTPS